MQFILALILVFNSAAKAATYSCHGVQTATGMTFNLDVDAQQGVVKQGELTEIFDFVGIPEEKSWFHRWFIDDHSFHQFYRYTPLGNANENDILVRSDLVTNEKIDEPYFAHVVVPVRRASKDAIQPAYLFFMCR
jgi:hypothetical protein